MVKYRLANENDYENINNFHNRVYQENRSMEQFLWEFHNGAFGKSIYVIAEDGNKVVGTNCVIPIVVTNANNDKILTGKSEDTLVDPDYRGQGIFNHIYDFLFEQCKQAGVQAIWGYTSAKKSFEKVGFSVPFDHQQGLIVNHVLESYQFLSSLNNKNKLKEKFQILGLCLFSKLKHLFGSLSNIKTAYTLVENQAITDQVESLLRNSNMNDNELFYILQNKEFQQWRIYDNPNYYKVHTYGAYDKSNKLVALIVLNSHANKVAYIVQSTFDNSLTEEEKVQILKHAISRVFSLGISIIRSWLFDTNEQSKREAEIYAKANFVVLNKGIGFVWKKLDNNNLNPNKFVLSRISTQGVI